MNIGAHERKEVRLGVDLERALALVYNGYAKEIAADGNKCYVKEQVRYHGCDSLLWGPDEEPMPVIRFTIREFMLIGRWK